MSSYETIRIHLDVLWIFRRKARFYRKDEAVLAELPRGGYSVSHAYFGNHYEPHALFDGRIYARQGQVIEVGKLLVGGDGNNQIARTLGVDVQTVARIRQAINEYRGEVFLCRCGKTGGHNFRCEQKLSKI